MNRLEKLTTKGKPRIVSVKGIYAIVDKKANAVVSDYLTLHGTEATAVRMFTDLYTSQNSWLAKHPEDYDLVRLGTLESDEDGCTIGDMTAQTIITGKTVQSMLTQDNGEL